MTIRIEPKIVNAEPLAPPPPTRRLPHPVDFARRAPLFMAMVVAPSLLAAVYLLAVASPIYVSEARFVVRAPTPTPSGGLTSMLEGAGLNPNGADAFAVHEYIMSRDAVADLEHRDLRGALARPQADFWSRFPRPFESDSNERLYRAYKRFVRVGYDATTGISTLQVRAFQPQDAQTIASGLLEGGEAVVNALNDQAERDAISEARKDLAEAEARVAEAQANLTSFRTRERLIDPVLSSGANLELVGRLSAELATLRAERAGLAAAAPQSPQLPGMDNRIRAYEREIEAERSKVAGQTNSLAPKIALYERLTLERDFAGKALSAAVASLESARLEARRKRLYLQRVVNPSLPDDPTLPHRLRSLAVVVITCLAAYAAALLVMAGLREHRQ